MVSGLILGGLAASAIMSAIWPAAIYFICRRRMALSARNIVVGAGVFLVFSQVLEKGMHLYVLKANPATAAWMQVHPMGFALYGCLAAGVFEEVGRYLGMRFLVKPTSNPGTAVTYGIGHGGIEAILIGCLPTVQMLFFARLLNSGQLDATLGPVLGPEALAQLRTALEHITIAGLAMGSLERLIAVLIQMGLSLVVWRAVEARQLRLLALAILLHALVDFPPSLAQAGQLSGLVVEAILWVVGAALIALFIYTLPRKGGMPIAESR